MLQLIMGLVDPQLLIAVFSAVAVIATILSLTLPLLERDRLPARMKTVAIERERIRARERARLSEQSRISLRHEPRAYMKRLVEGLNLREALVDEQTLNRLRMAGFRGQAPIIVFLFARFVLPFCVFAAALLYFFVIGKFEQPFLFKLGASLLVGASGFYLPILYVANVVSKRQSSIRQAWPDALDLILICVEAGMSVETAFRKVSEEIGAQSGPLAEELMLTTAELSYLPERRQAYENLASRTGIDSVKAVVTALIQAERYGTPLGDSLRVMAQESRDQRMNEAEKKAAALPPKLTVPMILFFLPVLFAVILGPAIIQVIHVRQ
ncbi:type II secretion system protein [Kaistia algarum]|uniref:type II secretion system F family protein n=1 Tax=Kaistia algarum TaxID=2083279 RepID=UPI000CE78063|nr:type II secretion system F family protein [Kaistia algarum]MCX5516646.1 type II secretion system F family protein [Kaistia algarum]PPE77265.1 type II secretion system protein [Kaistia algarum]